MNVHTQIKLRPLFSSKQGEFWCAGLGNPLGGHFQIRQALGASRQASALPPLAMTNFPSDRVACQKRNDHVPATVVVGLGVQLRFVLAGICSFRHLYLFIFTLVSVFGSAPGGFSPCARSSFPATDPSCSSFPTTKYLLCVKHESWI